MTRRYAFLVILTLFSCGNIFSETGGAGSAPEGEIRAVWAYPSLFGPDKPAAITRMRSTLDAYAKAGINTVMMLVKSTSGYVYFNSDIAVRDSAYDWDFFGTFLDEARRHNMVVHPWFCVFTEGGLAGTVRQRPDWLIQSRTSGRIPVVNPANPEARRYEIMLIREMVARYPVDWIHLDYIRWPCEPTEDYFSFDPVSSSLFKQYSGEDITAIRATDSGNTLWNEWIEWNGEQVTQFLRELRAALAESDRAIRISAAVFPGAANARALVGQDWAHWAETGLVDMLCPMLYTNNVMFFEKYVRRAVDIARGHCQLCIGIGVLTAHNQNTVPGLMEQINLSRRLGADGTVLFSSGSLTQEILDVMGSGD